MRIFYLVIGIVATATVLLPVIARRIALRYGVKLHPAPYWLPALAAAFYVVAPFLPDIHISRETSSFQEHFSGGGFYTALLYIYCTRLLGWRPRWPVAVLGLFAWTSTLGVVNELAEFAVTKLNITQIDIGDTSWDLTANTLGACTAYILYGLTRLLPRGRDK